MAERSESTKKKKKHGTEKKGEISSGLRLSRDLPYHYVDKKGKKPDTPVVGIQSTKVKSDVDNRSPIDKENEKNVKNLEAKNEPEETVIKEISKADKPGADNKSSIDIEKDAQDQTTRSKPDECAIREKTTAVKSSAGKKSPKVEEKEKVSKDKKGKKPDTPVVGIQSTKVKSDVDNRSPIDKEHEKNVKEPYSDSSQLMNMMKELEKPRIVISMIGAYNEFVPTYTLKHQLFLKEALTHVARCAGRCGFFYKETDLNCAATIIKKSCRFECLPMFTYGYTSTTSTDVHINNSEPEEMKKNNASPKDVLLKLSELECYINSEGRMPFENKIGQSNGKDSSGKDQGIRVPVVLLVMNGGYDTLEHVVRALDNNVSVVVVKGTGGTADLIALSLNDMTKLKRKLPVLFARRFSEKMCAEIKKILEQIVQRDWMITIFNLKKNNKEKLWEKITDGIMRAWSFEDMKDDTTTEPGNLFSHIT